MIARYSTPEMAAIWTDQSKFRYLLHAAQLAAEVTDLELSLRGGLRVAMVGARARIGASATQLQKWKRLEEEQGHDIAAFVEVVREQLPADVAEYFHIGRTSSDLVDTALAYQIRDSLKLINRAHVDLVRALARRADIHRTDPVLGRTHGQWAEPTSIGRRFAQIAFTLGVTEEPEYGYGKMTGPVGTRSADHSSSVLAKSGLGYPPATQIVPRYYLALMASHIAAATVPVSDLAVLIRLGSRSGEEGSSWCAEARQGTDARGSSSMPTKRNPVRSERASGLCTRIRAGAASIVEASAGLWEERDISHSSVERIALPELFALAEFVYLDMAAVVRDLVVRPQHLPLHTPAADLEYLVRNGVGYNEAYRTIRDATGEWAPSESTTRPYDPDTEPDLWEWIDEACRRA